jgi:hypothetical protein
VIFCAGRRPRAERRLRTETTRSSGAGSACQRDARSSPQRRTTRGATALLIAHRAACAAQARQARTSSRRGSCCAASAADRGDRGAASGPVRPGSPQEGDDRPPAVRHSARRGGAPEAEAAPVHLAARVRRGLAARRRDRRADRMGGAGARGARLRLDRGRLAGDRAVRRPRGAAAVRRLRQLPAPGGGADVGHRGPVGGGRGRGRDPRAAPGSPPTPRPWPSPPGSWPWPPGCCAWGSWPASSPSRCSRASSSGSP